LTSQRRICPAKRTRDGRIFYAESPAIRPFERAGRKQEAHGEEAASGALAEIAHDLEMELQRPMNPHVVGLSSHLEVALRHGLGSLSPEAEDAAWGRRDADLLRAFPFDRTRVASETLAYYEIPGDDRSAGYEPPFETFMSARLLLHRHMRLAFKDGASWLVEVPEHKREAIERHVETAS
jgi:hypothetical protein